MSKFVLRPGIDIIAMLKDKGYSTYVIAKAKERTGEYILGQSTLTKLRKGGLPSWAELAKLVTLLHVSIADLIAFEDDDGTIHDLIDAHPQSTASTTPGNMEQLSAIVPLDKRINQRIAGAVKYGYGSSHDQYILDAVTAKLKHDEDAERAKRAKARLEQINAYYDSMPDIPGDPPDDY